MSTKDNGGPAFPVTKRWNEKYADEAGYGRTREVVGLLGGMSLRDYFAAKAMQACVADPTWRREHIGTTAETAYAMADVMLKARQQ